jgi:hypothetical protein
VPPQRLALEFTLEGRTGGGRPHTPFVTKLKNRTAAESEVDGVEVGVGPGSEHTGIAVFTAKAGERRGRYSIQLDHRLACPAATVLPGLTAGVS